MTYTYNFKLISLNAESSSRLSRRVQVEIVMEAFFNILYVSLKVRKNMHRRFIGTLNS